MTTKTRDEMIADLTHDEMLFLAENSDKHNITEVADFFAKGGFNAYTDEALLEVFNLKYGENEDEEAA